MKRTFEGFAGNSAGYYIRLGSASLRGCYSEDTWMFIFGGGWGGHKTLIDGAPEAEMDRSRPVKATLTIEEG